MSHPELPAEQADGDLPLLDEAHAFVDEPPRTYDHVIVDEARTSGRCSCG